MAKNIPNENAKTSRRNVLATIAGVALLGALMVTTAIEFSWRSALLLLAAAIVVTGIQYLVGRCLRPKQVRLLFTGEVITLPGGRKP
jgi:hypothetical protein